MKFLKILLRKEKKQYLIQKLISLNFILKTQLGRYELTLDYLQEVNPKAALQASNYMNHETE